MKGSFQKIKINRKSSAKETSKERPVLIQKEDKLQQLKAKIEKDRDVMRKTGKRFNKLGQVIPSETNIHSEDIKQQENIEKAPFAKRQVKSIEVNTKQGDIAVQTRITANKSSIRLTQLIPSADDKSVSLQSSRIFDKEMKQQKSRNQQVQKFLKEIGLQSFAEDLINMGYDQLSLLVQVKAEELNFIMMRAAQQRKLSEALKRYRQKIGVQQEKIQTFISKPSAFKAKVKMNVQINRPATTQQYYRPKSALTETSTIPTNNSSLFNNSAFFCSIGGNQWSMDSLIRRACSSCFKVFPSSDLNQRDACYYCKQCTEMEEDLLGMNLSDSMVRDYS